MSTPFFHHPDISLTVLRRSAAVFFLDLLAFYGVVMLTRGRSFWRQDGFPSRTAYYAALSRLRKAGVVACGKRRDGRRFLSVERGHALPEALRPEKHWARRWDGIWRVLVYDIAETERGFRNGLRRHLLGLRMGCLQQSVWVSPDDLRAAYADLETTLDIKYVSYLFEARTVLGRNAGDVVLQAWDFERVRRAQVAFVDLCRKNRRLLLGASLSPQDVEAMAREELWAYLCAMEQDPLLPRKLLPHDYRGVEAYEEHTAFAAAMREHLPLIQA